MNLVVNYTITTGEFENSRITILEQAAGQSQEETVHEFFKDFWEDTECSDRASWEQALRITNIREVTNKEVEVLNKFGVY